MHSPELLKYFQQSERAGEALPADARVELENPVCGDRLVLSARVADGKLVEVRFLARGCVAAIGCAAALCEKLEGGTLESAQRYSREELLRDVGGLEPASRHAAALALEARDSLIRALHQYMQ
jgi:nitrogen fixation NifU-like protein